MTENELTNARQGMPVQGKMQSGWYAAQDDEQYLYIDQWVMFDRFLVVHILKKWSGDEDDDVEDDEYWYSDFDFMGTAPQLFATKEECRSNEESRQALIRAQGEMETNARDSKLIAALKEFNGGRSNYGCCFKDNLERVLGKMGCKYCNLSEKCDEDREESLLSAIRILRDGHFTCTTEMHGRTVIPLSSVCRVSLKEHTITVEMCAGNAYRISESVKPELYNSLREVFDV